MENNSGLFIGMMSGTSLDAVDSVLVDFSVPPVESLQLGVHIIGDYSIPIPSELKEELLALHHPGYNELERSQQTCLALGKLYAKTINSLISDIAIPATELRKRIIAAGIHGQTIRHVPQLNYTIQLNAPAWIAEHTGISVVSDFRSRDIAAGGEGAPLVPAFHHALFGSQEENTIVVLNLGGISNISVLSPDCVTGWDCGPANMLLDTWCHLHTHEPFDKNGVWASQGKCIPELLESFLADSFFRRPPPKSTGRDTFNINWLNAHLRKHARSFEAQDIQMTLIHLTARSIAQDIAPLKPATIWCGGGGTLNTTLMHTLSDYLHKHGCFSPIRPTSEIGIPHQQLEAVAFAWLAKQHVEQRTGNIPSVTGAKGHRILGSFTPA